MKLKLAKDFGGKKEVVVVAFDPGKAVGVAMCFLDRGDDGFWTPQVFTCELVWPGDAKRIRGFLLSANLTVCEDFRVTAAKAMSIVGDVLYSAQVIGWLIGLAELGGIPGPVLQSPEAKSRFSGEEISEKLGYWPTSPRDHEGDALKHLIYYLMG